MSDFQDALNARLARNREIEEEREQAREQMQRVERERAEEEERLRREEEEARNAKHTELVAYLRDLIGQLEEGAADTVSPRTGWTPSGEEFIAKLSSVGLRPKRSLFIELDRDDDEVLARWTSDVGESIELWRLHQFSTEMLSELVLQVIDEDAWRGRTSPPTFPGHDA